MNPQDQDQQQYTPPVNPSPLPPAPSEQVSNPLAAMQPGEQVICEIRRHPIGMIGIYIMMGFLLVALAIVVFAVAPSLFTNYTRSQVISYGAVLYLIIAVLVVAYSFIANIVYWGNRWIVTSDSITQISQVSLFNKQSSQLSLGNLEDVTAEQNGILPHLFGYGILKAETAGERSKFMFMYCPDPNKYAQKIIQAREVFEQGHRGGKTGGVNVNTQG